MPSTWRAAAWRSPPCATRPPVASCSQPHTREAVTSADPITDARAAGLRYVNRAGSGITRTRTPGGFEYHKPDGSPLTDEAELARIRALAIPPAYEGVWICPLPNGHLQATGRDARGRKQYRYHARWRSVRDEGKFERMLVFSRVLPGIRTQVAADLALPGLPRRRVLAAVVRLLETTFARIGNEEYARENKSFGLTTLRNRHAKVAGSHVLLDFRGKHGVTHHADVPDRRLANVIRRCRDIPGQHLFQYVDEDGSHAIGSEDVNEYLQEISGEAITAKDFRTWAATNIAAITLRELERFDSAAATKKAVLSAVEHVASKLGNTPAVCRKCYIHPAVVDGYLDGTLAEALKQRADAMLEGAEGGLTAEEAAVTAFLSQRLSVQVAPKGRRRAT